jgi:biopolymer transport protein ExbD
MASGKGSSGNGGDEYEITGINVTPLVDIMMVLLIIFLVTATYIVKEAIKIELPRAASADTTVKRTLMFLIGKDGQVVLDGAPANDDAIVRKIASLPGRREDMQAVIAADRDARHGSVVHVLDLLKGQGVTSIAIEVEKEPTRGP